jgi:hypothetical protein
MEVSMIEDKTHLFQAAQFIMETSMFLVPIAISPRTPSIMPLSLVMIFGTSVPVHQGKFSDTLVIALVRTMDMVNTATIRLIGRLKQDGHPENWKI